MARQTLNDIVTYLETKLATNGDLKGNIYYTERDSTSPAIRQYGAHIWVPETDPLETERRYLGPRLTEMWTLKLDIVLNRKYADDRKSVSDSRGISYWIDTVMALLLNGTNSGVFESSEWNYLYTDETGDASVLKGEFNVEINNLYT